MLTEIMRSTTTDGQPTLKQTHDLKNSHPVASTTGAVIGHETSTSLVSDTPSHVDSSALSSGQCLTL